MISDLNERNDKKTQILIVVATIVLTIAFILTAVFVGGTSGSKDRDNDYDNGTIRHEITADLAENDLTFVNVPRSGYVYYRFTPSTTGYYTFASATSSSYNDPVAILYSSSWSRLTSDDNSGEGNNFMFRHRLYSGSTYYLAIGQSGNASSSINITVYVVEEQN